MKHRDCHELKLLAGANPVPEESVTGWAAGEQGRQLLAMTMDSSAAPSMRVKPPLKTWRRTVMFALLISLVVGLSATLLSGFLRKAPERPTAPNAIGGTSLESLSRVAAEQTIPEQPAGGLRYTKTKSISTQFNAGPHPYTIQIARLRETWVFPDGSGKTRSEPASVDFPSEEDREAWEASGSPSLKDGGVERTFRPGELPYEDYSSLPVNPDQLFSVIRERASNAGPGLDAEMFIVIGDLLRSSHIPSELRASLFRVAARIPGVKITEDAVDPEGRRGVAASIVYDDQNGSLMEVERIFDKDTTQLMAETQTVVGKTAFQMSSPPPGFPESANRAMGPPMLNTPPGTVVGSAVYLKSGTVSAVGETPSGP